MGINYVQVVNMTREEEIKLYMELSKKELAEMLTECNRLLKMLSNRPKQTPSVVYTVLFADDKYESGMQVQSIHKTKQGARNALAKLLWEEREDIYPMNKNSDELYHLSDFSEWGIEEEVILD